MSTAELQREPYPSGAAVSHTSASARIGQAFSSSWMTSLEVAAELCAGTLAIMLSYESYHSLAMGKQVQYPLGAVFASALGVAVLIIVLLDRDGAYRAGNGLLRI